MAYVSAQNIFQFVTASACNPHAAFGDMGSPPKFLSFYRVVKKKGDKKTIGYCGKAHNGTFRMYTQDMAYCGFQYRQMDACLKLYMMWLDQHPAETEAISVNQIHDAQVSGKVQVAAWDKKAQSIHGLSLEEVLGEVGLPVMEVPEPVKKVRLKSSGHTLKLLLQGAA